MKKLAFILTLFLVIACKDNQAKQPATTSSKTTTTIGDTVVIDYAKGFSIVNYDTYKILKVKSPYPESTKTFTYLLQERGTKNPKQVKFDAKILIPVKKIVVTSTTHIPSLELLNEENTLVGFPHLDFISSPKTRARIVDNKIAELGQNTHLNTEVLLSLQPDVVIGFTMKENDKVYRNIENMNIPVAYDGDWNEKTPLGRAEWIKFFGVFYNKSAEADSIFNLIKTNYKSAKQLAQETSKSPTVLAGAMFKDMWYAPNGKSWMAQLIKDAKGDYVYKNTSGTGSLSLSIEAVLTKASQVDYWISPGGFTSYADMLDSSPHYQKFKAFKTHQVYSYALTKGATGGLLFFELGPTRPDLVLKDLIHIFHPDLLPNYTNTFYKPLR